MIKNKRENLDSIRLLSFFLFSNKELKGLQPSRMRTG